MKKRLLSIVLALLMLCATLTVSVLANVLDGPNGNETEDIPWGDNTTPEEPAGLRGDADDNGIVELKDCTRIRLYLAGRIALEDIAGDADADGNGTVELKDCTRIRLYLAGRIALEDM